MAKIETKVETKIQVVFWVKEDLQSPYQGHLQFSAEEFAGLKPGDLETLQLVQFAEWDARRKQAPKKPTKEEKQVAIADIEAQLAVLKADPELEK